MSKTQEIPAWEIPMLREIVEGRYPAAREAALQRYVIERSRRRRQARTRDSRDKERRTLVGAHVSRAKADQIRWIAEREDLSVTAFVNLAIRQAIERSDTGRDLAAPI